MKRREFLHTALGAGTLAGLHASAAGQRAPKQPNIVFIMADDLGYNDLSCFGAELLKTPRIDRLAEEGTVWTDAHAPASVCQPTRYAILSGRYWWRRGKPWQGDLCFDPGRIMLPQLLKDAGYRTACIGKWHLGFGRTTPVDWNSELKPGPLEIGFDYFFGTPRTHNEPPFVFVENHHVVGLDPDDPIRIIPNKETDKGYGHGISVGAERAHELRPEDEVDVILADRAEKWVKDQRRGEPFFLYLTYLAPHIPIAPSERFQGTSDCGGYGDYIQELDWCVGRVLDALDRKGLREDTLVIFTSDNGGVYLGKTLAKGHRCNGDLLGQKTDAWEGGVRIPFMARWPGKIPAGVETGTLMSLTDIMATCCSAAGVTMPAGAGPDSVDQLPVMLNPRTAEPARREMIMEGIFGRALRSDQWVYMARQGSHGMSGHPKIRWGIPYKRLEFENSSLDEHGQPLPDAPPGQLYDVEKDPNQKQNVYDQYPEVVKRLDRRLKELQE
ncbi:sulfatase-like hydrolase/transferase [Kiritimatiella glycovorans]|uniref:Arylsulfatase n=1 Tax=Kiritimatiella glycovorans TaxID=1307763 RepID=A0A0G3EBG6_9BACT|nr:sulfatase-like hydrolase/transferase [Kiritimatiella glycovorans]AKJ63643.1 Arylsulfatase [Kiritimatiella glycovorans]